MSGCDIVQSAGREASGHPAVAPRRRVRVLGDLILRECHALHASQLEKALSLEIVCSLLIGMASVLLAHSGVDGARDDPRSPDAAKPAEREKEPAGAPDSPWFIILNSPDDLAAFWNRLERPDLVVIKADQLATKGVSLDGKTKGGPNTSAVVESVAVRGEPDLEFVSLTLDYVISVKGTEAVWVPIRLDRQSLLGAREGSADLSLRQVDGGQWRVRLQREGEHRVEIRLRAPLTVTPLNRSFSLPIPEAASTVVELTFSHGESDIMVGANEVVGLRDPNGSKETRLAAHLSPRSKLNVSWTSDSESATRNPPVLTAKSEIAIDIDEEQMRARTSWAIRCVRGMARTLEIQIDDDEQVTEIHLDDESAESGLERVPVSGKLVIRLPEPLRPGATKRVVLKTRKPLAIASGRKMSFKGYPLANAREQLGFIGITQSANLFVTASQSRGLRRVDTDKLPENLRTRPSTSLAFEFLDQPFVLEMAVDSSPPLVKARSTTLFRIEGTRARSETRVELDWVRGSLSELEFRVASGLQLLSIGPNEIVESWHLADEVPSGPGGADAGARRLKVRLTPLGRDATHVKLAFTGQQAVKDDGRANLGLFSPIQAVSASASFVLVADRSLSLELDHEGGRIRRLGDGMPRLAGERENWPWTVLRAEQGTRPLVLEDDGLSSAIPIRIRRHARTLMQENAISVNVSRRWIEAQQRATLNVRFGSVSSLDMEVPAAVADRWEFLDKDIADREELGHDADGTRRYRLTFARPVVDRVSMRIHYRIPIAPGLDIKSTRALSIPWITFKDVEPASTRIEMTLANEVVLTETDPVWIRGSDNVRLDLAGDSGVAFFLEQETAARSAAFRFHALARDGVPVPGLVAPRLWLKTNSTGEDGARTSARYWVETHALEFPFALPDKARWIGARVDGRAAEQVDYDPAQGTYRLRFPAEVGSRPALVELVYQSSDQDDRSHFAAPRLLDGGIVLQTLWEIRLPTGNTLLGVPRGWSDENQWHWNNYLWERHPSLTSAVMSDWLAGNAVSPRVFDDVDGLDGETTNRYLFSRSSRPADIDGWIVSKSLLVVICSGLTLVAGFVTIFARFRFRTTWILVSGVALLMAVLVQPSITVQLLQSAVLGALLTLSGLLIDRIVVWWRARSAARGGIVPAVRPAPDSSLRRHESVGSDDSTAIRVRVPSTMDFVAAASVPLEVPEEPRGAGS